MPGNQFGSRFESRPWAVRELAQQDPIVVIPQDRHASCEPGMALGSGERAYSRLPSRADEGAVRYRRCCEDNSC